MIELLGKGDAVDDELRVIDLHARAKTEVREITATVEVGHGIPELKVIHIERVGSGGCIENKGAAGRPAVQDQPPESGVVVVTRRDGAKVLARPLAGD